jgi:hypothetical protein
MYISGRPIALGLKVTPIIAATDKIVRCVSCPVSYDGSDDATGTVVPYLNNYTHTNWFGSHLGSKTILAAGSSNLITWRPMSLKNFQFDSAFFYQEPVQSATSAFSTIGPNLVVAIVGGASLVYDIELLYYYEALSHPSAPFSGTSPVVESASNYFPSIEKFYSATQQLLQPENVGRIVSAASSVSSIWNKYTTRRNIPYYPSILQMAHRAKSDIDDSKLSRQESSEHSHFDDFDDVMPPSQRTTPRGSPVSTSASRIPVLKSSLRRE